MERRKFGTRLPADAGSGGEIRRTGWNDDLIERLREPWCIADDMLELMSEAADTIAQQQEMLDRALESNGDMMVRIGKLEAALRAVIDASNNTGIEMGTVGMRVAERVEDIALAALSSPDTPG